MTVAIEIHDGTARVNGKPVDLGSLVLEKELSRGANGVVFKATDPIFAAAGRCNVLIIFAR